MHNHRLFLLLVLAISAFVLLSLSAAAQDMENTPQVNVADQVTVDGTVTVASAYSDGPGWAVIHMDNGGKPGPVLGFRWLSPGWNNNIRVSLSPSGDAALTPTLFAMLHVDNGEVGKYEFAGGDLDAPAKDAAGAVITPSFVASGFTPDDQFLDGNTLTVDTVLSPGAGWLAIHQDNGEGRPGPVAGYAAVAEGVNTDVSVELDPAMTTSTLFPMLHTDNGTVGTYEFGSGDLDGPVRVGNRAAVGPLWTAPHVRAGAQIVTHGDGMEMMGAPTFTAQSVLSQGPGWLVIHQDNEGKPGPVAGYAAVSDGFNANVTIELDPAMVTPLLWPMLHVDNGTVGTYEFGTSDFDGPVKVGDQVVVFSVNAAPSIVYTGSLAENVLTVNGALIDAPGWLAIHADNGSGQPGPVIGTAPLLVGENTNIAVTVDAAGLTDKLFPMLHYDTGEAGKYEFAGLDGPDLPVFVGGNVVVGELQISQ